LKSSFDRDLRIINPKKSTVIDCLTGSMKLGDTMRDRQLCMVAYLFELGYDLMISPKFNLSRMPGFEEAAGLIPFEKDN
jgi:hypothetical protein